MPLPSILLLHGWGGSAASTWGAAWIDGLSGLGRRCIALDLPGHGPGPASTSPADYADLTGAVAGCLPDESVDVIGFSLGAKIALDLASRVPGRFRRAVVIGLGDNCFAPEPARDDVACALENGCSDGDPPHVQALLAYSLASGSDPKALAAILRRAPNPLLDADRLRGVTALAMLINGAADAIAMPDQRLREALRGVEYRVVAGLGHTQAPFDPRVRAAATAFVMADAT